MYKGFSTTLDYKNNGTPVECTVESIVRIENEFVEVSYVDDAGKTVYAQAKVNKKAYVGMQFTGYIMPQSPKEVIRMPSKTIVIIALSLASLMAFGCIFATCSNIKWRREYKILKQKGFGTQGQVVSTSRIDDNHFAKIRFVCHNGAEFTKKFGVEKTIPYVGNTYSLIYYIKSNGKCIAALTEF